MNKYGKAAVLSARILEESGDKDPRAVWNMVTSKIFGKGTSSQKKGCPRDAFLGLCEAELVKGVPAGKYTRSQLNKQYALIAVDVLNANPDVEFSADTLWRKVITQKKTHNSQMDVILALWKNDLLKKEDGTVSDTKLVDLSEAKSVDQRPQTQVDTNNTLSSQKSYSFSNISFVKICDLEPQRDSDGNLVEYMPQSRYKNPNSLPLHKYGKGPFCKFQIPRYWARKAGVYVLAVDGEARYVGECIDLASRFNAGYGNISPRNCYEGGQRTNCRINNQILRVARNGSTVTVVFHETKDRQKIERKLLRELKPEWNSTTE